MITQNLNRLLYFDIETVGVVNDFYSLPDRLADIYMRKNEKAIEECGSAQEHWNKHAGLEAEYAKVCCISFGSFKEEADKSLIFRVKSFCGENEVNILRDFLVILENAKGYNLAFHNGIGFDVPFLAKRYIINSLPIPRKLNKLGVKPWEDCDVDTINIWRGGNFQSKMTSLDLLTAVLGIESPKGDMDGSLVGEAFYAGEFDRISTYCQNDVVAVARVCQRMNLETPIADSQIRRV